MTDPKQSLFAIGRVLDKFLTVIAMIIIAICFVGFIYVMFANES